MAGNSVADAIVTVVPKLDPSGKANMETELGKAGDSGGEKFGAGFGASLKKVAGAAVVAEAAKIAADVFAGAFNNAADYEQLKGGVETLFKDSSDQLMKYASDAYKTAGISANQYMEQATSFSASLIQSLGGDTAKAADYADMAMIDMSDNANKMGTNIDSIQNAYQGFAKQNFTMLDNLKLGYGGTKEEMQRLLDDAEKISGIEYDISSFSDITEAIHVMQEEMGIAGTTSQEASDTVSGSITQMKASWEDLLIAMGTGENVEEAANNMVDSFITAMENIIPLAVQVIIGMGSALVTALGNVLAAGVTAIATKTYEFIEAGANLVRGMAEGVLSARDAVINKIREICSGAVDAIKSFFGIHSPSTVMRDLFGYVGEGMVLGLEDSQDMVDRSMESLLDSAYGKAAGFGIGLNAAVNGNGRATNADIVGAINSLHKNLGAIIENNTDSGMTPRQFGRAVRAYA